MQQHPFNQESGDKYRKNKASINALVSVLGCHWCVSGKDITTIRKPVTWQYATEKLEMEQLNYTHMQHGSKYNSNNEELPQIFLWSNKT